MPIGGTRIDGLGVTIGLGKPRILRRADDTLTPGVLAPDIPTFVLRADIVDRAVRLDAANRACESSLPEPGIGWRQNHPIRRSCLGIDNRNAS